MVFKERLVEAPHTGAWWFTTHHSCRLGTGLTIFYVEVTSVHEMPVKSAKASKVASLGVSPSVMALIWPKIEHFILVETTFIEVKKEKERKKERKTNE
jgi:hypothetical protein